MVRQVWKTDYARIMTYARATKELSAYERCHSAISINKGISFGLVPVVGTAAYAHIYKTKPTDLSKHKQAIGATIGLAVLTNLWAVYSSQQIPKMEDHLMEKYVWTLDDETLSNYAKGGRRWPNAK